MTLDISRVEMRDCRLLDISINTPTEINNEPGEVEIQLKTDYNVMNRDGNEVTVRFALGIEPTKGVYYTASLATLAAFVFPEGVDDEDIDGYLRSFAFMRMYDWSRAVLENASTTCILGSVRIPPNPPDIKQKA